MDQLDFIVEESGQRLDAYLASVMPQHSRSSLQKLCEAGQVMVDGSQTKQNHKVKSGQTVSVIVAAAVSFDGRTLPILYEDNDVVVINKPSGILTHAKGAVSEEFSVAEYVRPRTTDNPDGNRPGIVHRLDRYTSGVIIAAKTNDAKRWLQKQFSERKVKKTYIALVAGHPAEPTALLDLPIERNPKKPQTFRVGGGGKPAETLYEVVHRYAHHSLVTLKPHTGRTHQLRVHMHYIHCPIVGDPLYGQAEPDLRRMFLHASELEITLPSRTRQTFRAPLPPELQTFLNSLQ